MRIVKKIEEISKEGEETMSQKYTRKETEAQIAEAAKDMPTLYRAACVNHTGTTYKHDGNEYYTEIISEFLLQNFNLFSQIKKIPRADYKIASHTGTTPRPASNRLEERIALSLFQKNLRPIGKVIDYQIPLKSIQKDDAGKIDLMTFDESTGILRLIELKAPESKETLLRCVLEIYTYFKTVDIDALKKSYALTDKCTEIRICVLFFMNSNQDKEYRDLRQRPYFVELMKKISEKSTKVELLRFPFGNVKSDKNINQCPSAPQNSSSAPQNSSSAQDTAIPNSDTSDIVSGMGQYGCNSNEDVDNALGKEELWEVEILDY